MTTEAELRFLFADLGISTDDQSVTAKLEDDFGMDSLDRIELAMALEERFGIDEIPDAEECSWVTLLDVVQYVNKQKAKAGR